MSDKQVKNKEYFTVYWTDGSKSFLVGDDIRDAFVKAGYGQGAMHVVDHYQRGFDYKYRWASEIRNWELQILDDQTVNLYDIEVSGMSFDKTITEGFLLKLFTENEIEFQQQGEELRVAISDLEKIFNLKIA